jgi:hypothetical protein
MTVVVVMEVVLVVVGLMTLQLLRLFSLLPYDAIARNVRHYKHRFLNRLKSRRVLSSGIYRRVVHLKSTNVSEERIASIFRVKE